VVHMATALLAAIQYTVTGAWPRGREPGETRGDER